MATIVSGDTKTLYVSGQMGSRGSEALETFAAQIEAVFANMADPLAAAGTSMADSIKLNRYIIDIIDICRDKVSAYSQAHNRYIPADMPLHRRPLWWVSPDWSETIS